MCPSVRWPLLSAVFKQEGDSVKRGELLAVLDSTMTEDYRIVSPVDGLIAKQWVVPGDLLQPGENIFTLNEGKKLLGDCLLAGD